MSIFKGLSSYYNSSQKQTSSGESTKAYRKELEKMPTEELDEIYHRKGMIDDLVEMKEQEEASEVMKEFYKSLGS